MAWRGGRCLAALYLETAAGLRQRSVRKEEALAAAAFEQMRGVGDARQFDPAVERAKLEACAKTVAQLGAARAARVADLARQAGLREVPRSVVSQPMRWRDGVLRPDRSALDPAVLQLWYRPSPKTSRAVQGGFVRSHTEPMSSLRDGAARSLERQVASYKDGVLDRIQRKADAVYAVVDRHRDKLVDAVDDASRAALSVARGRFEVLGVTRQWGEFARKALPEGFRERVKETYNQKVAPELARLRSAPRKQPTVDVPTGLVDVLALERVSPSDFAVEWHREVPAEFVGALSPSSSLDVRLRSGDRALAWTVLAATSSLPIYRSWRFAAEWSETHQEIAQGALVVCGVSLLWAAYRARGIDEDRLKLDLQRVLRVHRTASGDEALDKVSRLAARAAARGATDAVHAGSCAGASDGVRELLSATGLLRDGDAVPRPRDAEAILGDYLTDRLTRGAARALDVDSMDEPGMISV